jgi:hypothetical protein
MGTIGQDVKKSIKGTAKGSGKKAAREPIEILKTATSQISGSERTSPQFDSKEFYEKSERKDENITNEQIDEIEAKRRKMLSSLEAEIDTIRKEREEKDRRRKESFAAKDKKDEVDSAPPSVSSKRSRNLRAGMPGKLDKLKRKSEIRMPPSG